VKAAQGGHVEYLAWLLSKLDPSNLNTMLTQRINNADGNETILNLLVGAAQNKHVEYLA
jgi:hypothetical protein